MNAAEGQPPTGFATAMATLQGRCISCGFLAKHAEPGGNYTTYFEVETAERTSGLVFSHVPDSYGGPVKTTPICFRNACALGQEIVDDGRPAELDADRDAARRVFLKDRHCDQWFQYTPGLSPQQHLGDLAMREQEERQYKFQQSLEARREEWERKLERERRKFDLALGLVVALLAVAQVAATILAVFFQ